MQCQRHPRDAFCLCDFIVIIVIIVPRGSPAIWMGCTIHTHIANKYRHVIVCEPYYLRPDPRFTVYPPPPPSVDLLPHVNKQNRA